MYDFISPEPIDRPRSRWKRVLAIGLIIIGGIALGQAFTPPSAFPADTVITIEQGQSLGSIARNFEDKGLVRSAGIFETLVVLVEGDRGIAAGDYVFEVPVNALELARRVTGSDFGIGKISVTLPEGLTIAEMASVLDAKLSNFDAAAFVSAAKPSEGYLFPDTYYFFATTDAPKAIEMLKKTFDKKVTRGLAADFAVSPRAMTDIIIMSSIVEAEAHGSYEEKRMIAGILWKRLDEKMRLQVDATLAYVTGRGSAELTIADLEDDHPYNTYTRFGLPPTPIGNPGLDSIRAALDPKPSEYYFYLHDKDGTIRYAKNFEEHKKNIATYLK